jgi:hypothetical protein
MCDVVRSYDSGQMGVNRPNRDGAGVSRSAGLAEHGLRWRRRRESNPCTRFCRPLPGPLGHVATGRFDWLPREDSNLGSRIQSPLSYH